MSKFIFTIFSIFVIHAAPAFALDASQIPFIERTWDSAPNFSETKVLKIINDKNLKNEIPLTLVIFKDSGWTLDEVMAKLRRTAEIFGVQCGINFNPVMILETRSIGGPTFDREDPWDHIIYSSFESSGAVLKPLMYFAKNEVHDYGSGGTAWSKVTDGGRKYEEVRDTGILLRNFAIKSDYSVGLEAPMVSGRYEILAHELAHILMDVNHELVAGNIMTKSASERTNKVLPSQCERIQENFFSR